MFYLHTIRYLRPSQVFWRVWRKLPVFRTPDSGPAPARRQPHQPLAAFPRKRRSMVAADTVRFLNEEHRLAAAADWSNPRWEALWLYNLHYFDDLCAGGAAERVDWHRALIKRWIVENRVGQGCGWDPYPTSLRIVNWIKWALASDVSAKDCRPTDPGGSSAKDCRPTAVGRDSYPARDVLNDAAIHSLAMQARFLALRIEWHLLGNHVLANAKALVFAGCYFEGAEAEAWLSKGFAILREQLAEQVLPDGGHFERSTMYHAIVLEDVLDLINLSRTYPGVMPENLSEVLRAVARKMLRWSSLMTHPDGEIPFFNDAAFGVAANFADLSRYAERLGIGAYSSGSGGLTCLHPSGYIRLAQGPVHLIFDVGPVGPDYLPGHAHADTLSFELCYGGQRVLCNSGTSQYGRGKIRHWERSTAAHNTVEIDGENSSEVWDGFRVARRAYPVGLSWSEEADTLRVVCAHDGYARLHGRPMHRRTLEVSGHVVRWFDEVLGAGEHRVVGRIPLHPEVSARRLSETAWRLDLPSGTSLMLAAEGEGVKLDEEKGRFSPEFGLTLERTVLVWVVSGTPPFSVAVSLRPFTD